MAQPQPVLRLDGTVALARRVQPPAYTPSKDGAATGPAVTPAEYGELTIQTEQSALDGELVELGGFATVRCDPQLVGQFGRGQQVALLVRSYAGVIRTGGRLSNIVVHLLVGQADVAAQRRELASSV